MKGRNPTKKEVEHMDKVSQLGCIVCRNMGLGITPAEIHHIEGKIKYYPYVLGIIERAEDLDLLLVGIRIREDLKKLTEKKKSY